MEALRTCKCGVHARTDKDLELFVKTPGCKHDRSNECCSCYRARKRGWAKNNPKKIREKSIKYTYGITLPEYDKCMETSVECEICNKQVNLVYDHDHSKRGVEAFRGVLCSECNRAIGMLGDTYNDLYKAMEYLKRYEQQVPEGQEIRQSQQ